MIQSCHDEEVIPYCEEYHTCTVKITNSTGYEIKVDVDNINEYWLLNGYTTTYEDVSSGYVRIWASFDGNNWVYWDEYVSDCNTLNFNIEYYKKSIPITNQNNLIKNVDFLTGTHSKK